LVASEDAGGDVDFDVASVGKCDGVQEVEVLGTNSSGSEGEGDGGGRGGSSSFVCTDVRGEDESPSCAMKLVVMSGRIFSLVPRVVIILTQFNAYLTPKSPPLTILILYIDVNPPTIRTKITSNGKH
jgi:hypothetical protein